MWQWGHPGVWAPTGYYMTAQQAHQPHFTQRPAAPPRDDAAVDTARAQRARDRERRDEQRREELRQIREEMDSLIAQLGEARDRADQAERVADELTKVLDDKFSEMAVDNHHHGDESADTAVAALQTENKKLKAELDEARSHIFSLQPYRNDLTPKEVGQVSSSLPAAGWHTN